MTSFNGLGTDPANLFRLSSAKSRSICGENLDGSKGGGGRATEGFASKPAAQLGPGWKINPAIHIEPGATTEIALIDGPGAIQQIWMTGGGDFRKMILRFYWDDLEHPSVECPLSDFFACGWKKYSQINSMMVCVNPGLAFNCYWVMPFRKRCRVTIENLHTEQATLFYQINYVLNDVTDDAAYFHAQFRRENPVAHGRVFNILDDVEGQGHYVGTSMAWQVNNNGWWGEGEIKFYMDGDWPAGEDCAEHGGKAYPTICGTGTEDYFGGSYNFDPSVPDKSQQQEYRQFSTPYTGMPLVLRPNGIYDANTRFGLYRWHITDPIRFEQSLVVTIQDLGWRNNHRFNPQQSDIASVAYWYQTLPHKPFPILPTADELEII